MGKYSSNSAFAKHELTTKYFEVLWFCTNYGNAKVLAR
jgi:hypothetical protein